MTEPLCLATTKAGRSCIRPSFYKGLCGLHWGIRERERSEVLQRKRGAMTDREADRELRRIHRRMTEAIDILRDLDANRLKEKRAITRFTAALMALSQIDPAELWIVHLPTFWPRYYLVRGFPRTKTAKRNLRRLI
jgi:hypothetical protein